MVVHDVWTLDLEKVRKARIVDVHLYQPGCRVDVLPLAGTEVVDDDHLVTGLYVGIHDMGADKASPARDKDFHSISSPFDLFYALLL
jgi:hypothetical protein